MYPRCLSILLCGVLSVSAGCSEDANPPRIISAVPAADSLNASRSGIVRVQFNEELRENSIPDDAIIVEHNGVPIAGNVSFQSSINTISFAADAPLFFLRQYDVTLSGGIADRKGNATADAGSEWSFWVADGTFSSNILIENADDGDATEPRIAFGPSGHGQIIWTQSDGTRTNIHARTIRDLNLGTPVSVEDDADDQADNDVDAGDATSPQIAVDNDGNALAVWVQFDGTLDRIYANRFSTSGSTTTPPSFTWSKSPLPLSDSSDASAPQIAIGPDGNAIAIWVQSDGRVYANRYTSSWGTAAAIDADTGAAAAPQIVIDSNNNAIAIWAQNNRIYVNRHTAGSWGTAAPIDNATGTATTPQIAVDSNGNAIAVWSQPDGTYTSIWANRFTANAWGAAATIESLDGDANTPQIAMNQAGNAFAAWSQSSPSAATRFRIRGSHFSPAGGWSTDADPIDNFNPEVFVDEVTEEGVSTEPHIAFDDDGNALVVWKTEARIDNVDLDFIAANRYRGPAAHEERRGWDSAAIIESNLSVFTGDAGGPKIAIAPDFTAVAIWSKADDDDLFHIVGSAFN